MKDDYAFQSNSIYPVLSKFRRVILKGAKPYRYDKKLKINVVDKDSKKVPAVLLTQSQVWLKTKTQVGED